MDRSGRLSVRPGPPAEPSERTGLLQVGDAAVLVPDVRPYRLMVLLHGAGGSAGQGLGLMSDLAAERGLLLVAPQSTARTWDVIGSGYGADVRRLDEVLTRVTARYPVDGMSIGGFSDGASYALSLGLINGDVFDSILAFSPGFAAPPVTRGAPRIFVAHGTGDRVLPIDRCSRTLVPRLRAAGYDVTYEEFAGGHEVPPAVRRQALRWLYRGVSVESDL